MKLSKQLFKKRWHNIGKIPFVLQSIGLATFLLLFTYGNLYSQEERTITGTIVSVEDNLPLPGVNVVIKGTTKGAITDINGVFEIEAAPDNMLQISFLGYESQEFLVGQQTNIAVQLVPEFTEMDEVVVIGYGTMKKANLSSAQVSVGSEEIEQANATTLDQVLQGRAAGVYVTQNSGQPGGGVSVNIRGINTISGGSEPLYVIDGVQVMGTTGPATNALSGINPNDIESYEILQGPTATAVYGSRAGNGVVVITTKRGIKGKTLINYTGSYGIQGEPNYIPVLNLREYAQYTNEYNTITNQQPLRPEFQDPSVLGEGTDWQNAMYNRAPQYKHQLSLRGGGEKTTFFLSAEYFDQEGVAKGSGFTRGSFRMNLDNEVKKWLNIGSNLSISRTSQIRTASNEDENLLLELVHQAPDVPVKNQDGSWGGPTQTQFMTANPIALATIKDDTERKTFGLGGIFAQITPIEGLRIRAELNGNVEYGVRKQYEPSFVFNGYEKEDNLGKQKASNNYSWNFLQLVEYNKKLGIHEFSIMASHEAQERAWEDIEGTRTDFVSNTIRELSAGDPSKASASSSKGSWAMESYFGRLNYIFNDRYIFQGTLRYDGSSNFGPDNRWALFPAAAIAWRISNENFMSGISQINNLKLRFEVGKTGNQNSGGSTYYSTLNSWATEFGSGFMINNYSNKKFQWEETFSYDVGLDVNMFRNRFELIFDVYYKEIDNLMLKNTYSYFTGTTIEYFEGAIYSPWVNVGAMVNKGFDITINTVNLERPLIWETGITFSVFRNELTKLYTESAKIDRDNDQGVTVRSVEGEPLWQFYLYDTEGLFQSIEEIENHPFQNENNTIHELLGTWVGDVKFRNVDGNDEFNEQDRTFLGNPWPKFTYGITNTFGYKNLELYIAITGVYGNDIFNWVRFKNEKTYGGGPGWDWNYLSAVEDYARIATDGEGNPYIENSDTEIPRITTALDPNGNYRASDMFIEDGSYLRIKNVRLSYTLPAKIIEKTPLTRVTLSASVQNLYTFTKYKGYDPEIGLYAINEDDESDGYIPGFDYGRYPSTRLYQFSVNVNF